jgi:hypothetical protein
VLALQSAGLTVHEHCPVANAAPGGQRGEG